MRRSAILALVAVVVAPLMGFPAPRAEAASLPDFPMYLPVQWGVAVKAGGTHTHASGVNSSVDFGVSNRSIDVVAAADGVVTIKSTSTWNRCYAVVEHQDGWQTQYYHLKNIPSTLQSGQRVKAGQKIGMTGMPGVDTCGRGTFTHVHFSLYRGGVEQNISGLSLGGYTITGTSGNYCGYWRRNSDGVIVADARKACSAVPQVTNTISRPGTGSGGGGAPDPPTSDYVVVGPTEPVPVPATKDTIAAGRLYTTPGTHTVNGRVWRTTCAPYSKTQRCTTHIWGKTIKAGAKGYEIHIGWAWNNLTYKPMPRRSWGKNPLARTGQWTSADGRRWRTECDTAASGRNGCRSYIFATLIAGRQLPDGSYRFTRTSQWVTNNLIAFSR